MATSNLLEENDDDLHAKLGGYLARQTMGARPPSRNELIQIGKRWTTETLLRERERLCSFYLIRRLRATSETDAVKVFAGVVSALALLGIIDLQTDGSDDALYAFGALVMKSGLDKLCPDP
jgi:hypothetical protein